MSEIRVVREAARAAWAEYASRLKKKTPDDFEAAELLEEVFTYAFKKGYEFSRKLDPSDTRSGEES